MKIRLLYAAAILALCAQGAAAQNKPPKSDSPTPQPVDAAGCPRAGVEKGCMVLTSKGKTYNITAANPKPDLDQHRGISLRGTTDPGAMSYCMQGRILKDIKWEYTKQRCPVPKKKQ